MLWAGPVLGLYLRYRMLWPLIVKHFWFDLHAGVASAGYPAAAGVIFLASITIPLAVIAGSLWQVQRQARRALTATATPAQLEQWQHTFNGLADRSDIPVRVKRGQRGAARLRTTKTGQQLALGRDLAGMDEAAIASVLAGEAVRLTAYPNYTALTDRKPYRAAWAAIAAAAGVVLIAGVAVGSTALSAIGLGIVVAMVLCQSGVQWWMKRTTIGPQQYDVDRRTVAALGDAAGLLSQLRHLVALADPFTEPVDRLQSRLTAGKENPVTASRLSLIDPFLDVKRGRRTAASGTRVKLAVTGGAAGADTGF